MIACTPHAQMGPSSQGALVTFDRAWVLAVAWLPLAWMVWEWRRSTRTLPDVAEAAWRAPANARKGIPRAANEAGAATDLWPWLALLGGIGVLADWLLFGRSRAFRVRAA